MGIKLEQSRSDDLFLFVAGLEEGPLIRVYLVIV